MQGECSFTLTLTMVPTFEVRVTVSDPFNSVDDTLTLEISVEETFVASRPR